MYKFKVGDQVKKVKGYRFCGTVVAVYHNLAGEIRLVVEHRDGWQHIFNEDQMELEAPF